MGQVIHVTGWVINAQGQPLTDVRIEIWQVNAYGRYSHPSDAHPAPLDPNDEDVVLKGAGANRERLIVSLQPPTSDLESDSLMAIWDIVLDKA